MNDHVDIGRVRLERLPEHQPRLAMLLRARALNLDASGECRISTHGLPGETERVAPGPDVVTARADRVRASIGFVCRLGRAAHGADILDVGEHADRLGLNAAG